jgi:hypothetical protein
MSLMEFLKQDIGSKKKDAAPAAAKASASTAVVPASDGAAPAAPAEGKPAKAAKAKGAAPALSSVPRANLLPPEIGENAKRRATRRGLRLMVVGAVIVAIGGGAAAFAWNAVSQVELLSAQSETQTLSLQVNEFSDVRAAQQALRDGEAAVRVAGSTDIDWADYLTRLQGTLPADVTLTDVAIESAGIEEAYAQSELPLAQRRIAVLTFTAQTTVLPSIPSWIEGMRDLPGFAEATPGTLVTEEGIYTATVTMTIDEDAYSHHFAPEPEEGQE